MGDTGKNDVNEQLRLTVDQLMDSHKKKYASSS